MSETKATARVKINKLLEAAGWRLFPDRDQPANIRLEPSGRSPHRDLMVNTPDYTQLQSTQMVLYRRASTGPHE